MFNYSHLTKADNSLLVSGRYPIAPPAKELRLTILEKNGYSSYADYWQSLKKERENKSEVTIKVTTKTKRVDISRANSSVMN